MKDITTEADTGTSEGEVVAEITVRHWLPVNGSIDQVVVVTENVAHRLTGGRYCKVGNVFYKGETSGL